MANCMHLLLKIVKINTMNLLHIKSLIYIGIWLCKLDPMVYNLSCRLLPS